jgi:hypothetical protein
MELVLGKSVLYGSVHPISYSIDPATYENLGNRINERKPLDSSKITW